MRRAAFSLLLIMCLCASVFAQADSSKERELSPFDGTIADAIWTVITFGILLLALWKMAWKPILNGLKSREEYIAKEISDAEKLSQNAREVLADYRSKLNGFEQEGQRIIDSHVKQAQEQGKEIIADTRKDADAVKAKSQLDIERSWREAETELLVKSGEIVLKLGQEIRSGDREAQRGGERAKDSGKWTLDVRPGMDIVRG